MTQRMNPNCWC